MRSRGPGASHDTMSTGGGCKRANRDQITACLGPVPYPSLRLERLNPIAHATVLAARPGASSSMRPQPSSFALAPAFGPMHQGIASLEKPAASPSSSRASISSAVLNSQPVSAWARMTAHHLYRIFVKGAGRQRVGRQSRSALNKAVSRALREGLIDQRNDTGQTGVENRILRKAGTPSVIVRPRGNREFTEIPPSEVATVILRLRQWNPLLLDRTLYRAVLDFYETKRMTTNTEQRLRWIFERRHELAGVEGAHRGDSE